MSPAENGEGCGPCLEAAHLPAAAERFLPAIQRGLAAATPAADVDVPYLTGQTVISAPRPAPDDNRAANTVPENCDKHITIRRPGREIHLYCITGDVVFHYHIQRQAFAPQPLGKSSFELKIILPTGVKGLPDDAAIYMPAHRDTAAQHPRRGGTGSSILEQSFE